MQVVHYCDIFCPSYNPFDDCKNDNSNHIKALLLIQSKIVKQELNAEQQEIIMLAMQGKSQTEIAQLFNVSKSTICRNIKKCLAILSKYMFFCDEALRLYENIELTEEYKNEL